MQSDTAPTTIIDQLRNRKTFLETHEVMNILGVTRDTLCAWVRQGRIQAVRIGKANKFDPATLVYWLQDRTI
jgi:excisionase family DNA binding protein